MELHQFIKIARGDEPADLVLRAAHQLGSTLHDPFMTMSFLALAVIPALKITDQGLVDVVKFQKIPLFVE